MTPPRIDTGSPGCWRSQDLLGCRSARTECLEMIWGVWGWALRTQQGELGHMMQEKWAQGPPTCSVLPRKLPSSRGRPQSLRLKSHFPFLFGFTCFVHCTSPQATGCLWAVGRTLTSSVSTAPPRAFSGGSLGQGPGVGTRHSHSRAWHRVGTHPLCEGCIPLGVCSWGRGSQELDCGLVSSVLEEKPQKWGDVKIVQSSC